MTSFLSTGLEVIFLKNIFDEELEEVGTIINSENY